MIILQRAHGLLKPVTVHATCSFAVPLRHQSSILELHVFVTPSVVGGGTAALSAHVRVALDLLDMRRFVSGVVHLLSRTKTCGGVDAA